MRTAIFFFFSTVKIFQELGVDCL